MSGKVAPESENTKEPDKDTVEIGADGVREPFDWREAKFTERQRIPLTIHLSLLFVISLIGIIVPIILTKQNILSGSYSLLGSAPPKEPKFAVELLRWVLFLSMGVMGYTLTNICAVLTVYVVFYFYKSTKRDTPQGVRTLVNHMLSLRFSTSLFVASLVLLVGSYSLFPLSETEMKISLLSGNSSDGVNGNVVENTHNVMSGLALANLLREYRAGHSTNFFVNRLAAAFFSFAAVLLIEKIAIQNISVTFFHRSFGERMRSNTFAIKTTKKLRNLIVHRRPELSGGELANIVFQGLCPSHQTFITMGDVAAYMPVADAEKYFQLLDFEVTGEVNKQGFDRAIKHFFEEQDSLQAATLDQAQIIKKLDRVLFSMCIFIVIVICTMLFQVSFQTVLTALAGIIAFLWTLSSNTVKTAFESIIFVIFTHPFDVGDRVLIKEQEFVVKELGLWTCAFEGAGNELVYIANDSLKNSMIVNNRRSPFQSEVIKFSISPNTPMDQIRRLEGRLIKFLQQNSKDYVAGTSLQGFNIINKDAMQLEMPLTHRGNFQDGDVKALRTKNFLLFLKEALIECGISLSPPSPIVISRD